VRSVFDACRHCMGISGDDVIHLKGALAGWSTAGYLIEPTDRACGGGCAAQQAFVVMGVAGQPLRVESSIWVTFSPEDPGGSAP